MIARKLPAEVCRVGGCAVDLFEHDIMDFEGEGKITSLGNTSLNAAINVLQISVATRMCGTVPSGDILGLPLAFINKGCRPRKISKEKKNENYAYSA